MSRSIRISPSILSADFARLGEEIKVIEDGGADLVHIDVMDGHFVPNITIGALIVEAVRPLTSLPLDVHLMISDPDRYLADFADAGADLVTVHYEACTHLHRTIQATRELGCKVGVALNPHTPLSVLEDILPDLDMVVVMTVNPGFAAQPFIRSALEKVTRLRKILRERGLDRIDISADGGVKLENAAAVAAAGANILVSGSGIYGQPDPKKAIAEMRRKTSMTGD